MTTDRESRARSKSLISLQQDFEEKKDLLQKDLDDCTTKLEEVQGNQIKARFSQLAAF